jgi:hypothetical protein
MCGPRNKKDFSSAAFGSDSRGKEDVSGVVEFIEFPKNVVTIRRPVLPNSQATPEMPKGSPLAQDHGSLLKDDHYFGGAWRKGQARVLFDNLRNYWSWQRCVVVVQSGKKLVIE